MTTLKFTTLTPLHISNGDMLCVNIDYIIKNGTFSKLNMLSISEKLASKKVFDFGRNFGLESVKKIISENQKLYDDADFKYQVELDEEFIEHLNNPEAKGQKEVREFINSNGNFYVPASSVKGAILTALNKNKLGIDSTNASISDKFVIHDSKFIPQENFKVFRTNDRPPIIGIVCLKPGTEFEVNVTNKGRLNIADLRSKLREYSSSQYEKALEVIRSFKSNTQRPKGADIFENALENLRIVMLEKDEHLINIGFGGGSWFKVNKGVVPNFPSKKPENRRRTPPVMEPAHTSITFESNPLHIGWCKLRIEEK